MSILRFAGVTREVGTFVILDEIEAAVALGDRIGLVGPNGAGKTTLLRLAAGGDEPDRGTIQRKRGLSIGLLAQESHFDAAFMAAPDLRAAVRTGAAHLDVLGGQLAELERAGRAGGAEYADLQHRFEVLGGYTLDQRVDATLSGLGFTEGEWAKPPAALSGGEQTRAALARLVIADPDLLMLDEPTNHLDLDALEWLEEHLRRRSGSLLVASHDRAFLDATVTRIWELRDRRLTPFRGDYASYHRQRQERDARAVKDADTQVDQIARERELIQRYRSHRKFAKMHEHEARLERLLADRREAPRARRKLTLPQASLVGTGPSRSGEIVVRITDLAVGYLPGRGATAPDGSGEPLSFSTLHVLLILLGVHEAGEGTETAGGDHLEIGALPAVQHQLRQRLRASADLLRLCGRGQPVDQGAAVRRNQRTHRETTFLPSANTRRLRR